ncbi:MAG: toll/interleukin-1 receptor domain-containing protein [Chloroflexi bacterium]|nr:toll/interleukin-1 receptor domain-containing protein [Chloroflexota bacterium]
MTDTTKRYLHVFLCHASEDKSITRELYQSLIGDGFTVWLDEKNLLPGQEWEVEIEKAVANADVVIVCLSNKSVSKEGYVQKELRYALDIALEKPEGTIFIIPLKLDDCQVPRRLRFWQWVDYFPTSQREAAYERLIQSLRLRANSLGCALTRPVSNDLSETLETTYLKDSVSRLQVAEKKNKEADFNVQSQRKVSWLFLPFWTIASLTGVVIGLSVLSILNLDFFPFVIMGLAIGLGQWILLYRKISNSGWWVLASVIGFTVAGIEDGAFVIESWYTGVIYGLIAGTGQWLILRQQIANSKIWIIFCALGWGIAWAIGLLLESYGVSIGTGFWVLGLIFGVLGGGSTGGMMVWLLNQHHYNPNSA